MATGSAKLSIALPDIASPGFILPGKARTNYLSSATASVRVRFGLSGPGTTVPVSVAAGNCKAIAATFDMPNASLRCRVTLPAPTGANQTLRLQTYKTVDGKGSPLAQSLSTITTVRGANETSAPFVGLARRMVVGFSANEAWQGTPCSIIVTVYGIDASGSPIPSRIVNGPNGKPLKRIVLSGNGPYTFSSLVSNGPGYPVYDGFPFMSASFKYDGSKSGTEKIVATAASGGLATVASKLAIKTVTSTSPLPQIYAASGDGGNPYVIEGFSAAAVGNVSPAISFTPPAIAMGIPIADDSFANFWLYTNSRNEGIIRYNKVGTAVGAIVPFYPAAPQIAGISASALDPSQNVYTVNGVINLDFGNCFFDPDQTKYHAEVEVYAAGSYGARRLRTLDIGHQCSVSPIAVDGAGDVFLGEEENGSGSYQSAQIIEYGPPDSSGASRVVRTIPQSSGGNAWLGPFLIDASGNLLEVNTMTRAGGLLEFAPGSTTPTMLLTGYTISHFALDSLDNIYAEIQNTNGTFQIAVFARGSNVPTRTIDGPNTGLVEPMGVSVTP